MRRYREFKTVFLTKSNDTLLATIRASQRRFDTLDATNNQIEIDRIQAATDVLDGRGYYNAAANAAAVKNTGSLVIGAAVILSIILVVS